MKSLGKAFRGTGLKAEAFHSDLSQKEREEILLKFKNRNLPILIGTDVLSRGIDVEGIDLVVNFDVPHDAEDYVHRIGRTARAATKGTAITFVNGRDKRKLLNIEKLIEKEIPRKDLPEEIAAMTVSAEVKPAHRPSGNRPAGNGTGKPSGKPKRKFFKKKA